MHHFVLIHGACHGPWCWYKVKPLLESTGHRVTALDLLASGINEKSILETETFHDYTEPLLELLASLGSTEKVILVGHSLGGLNLALAMEIFPEKIAVAVFLTAFMPDLAHYPGYVLDQFVEKIPVEAWLDTKFIPHYDQEQPSLFMLFGPNSLSSLLYQLSPVEDLELAKVSVRTGPLRLPDLLKVNKLSEEKYGSVKRVYIVCTEDITITEEFQRGMIDNYPVEGVFEINGADHMPMFSTPDKLCACLSQIAKSYAQF